MSNVKILRLTTGEDVIADVGENDQGISLNKPFVIIPQQKGPGQPIQLMMSLYNAFGKTDTVTLQKDKILLVDDVITSGATIYGCLKAIQNENSKITVAALAVNSEDLF